MPDDKEPWEETFFERFRFMRERVFSTSPFLVEKVMDGVRRHLADAPKESFGTAFAVHVVNLVSRLLGAIAGKGAEPPSSDRRREDSDDDGDADPRDPK